MNSLAFRMERPHYGGAVGKRQDFTSVAAYAEYPAGFQWPHLFGLLRAALWETPTGRCLRPAHCLACFSAARFCDPALQAVGDSIGAATLTVSAPGGLAPFVLASGRRGTAHGTCRHEHRVARPRISSAAGQHAAARPGRALPGVGDAAARAAVAARGHRRPAARRPAPPRPSQCRRSLPPARCPSSSRPVRARCCSRRCRDLGELVPRSSCVAGDTGLELTEIVVDLVGPGTRAPNWSRSAATSPCAAASSTSSRRPRNTRCGSSSGATRSRRSGTSRSPTSARSRSPSTVCGPRRVANCCSPTTCSSGRRRCSAIIRSSSELLDPISRGEAVEGMEALAPALVDDLALVLDELPAGAHVVLCDPERIRSRAADLVSTSQEFLDASWAAAAGGGKAPVDLGAASLQRSRRRRGPRGELGLPWWGVTALTSDLPGTVTSAFAGRRGPIAATSTRRSPIVREWARDGWRVALVFDGHGSASRAAERLAGAEIPARLVADVTGAEPGVVDISTGCLLGGLVAPGAEAGVAHRGRPHRSARVADQGHQPPAVAPAQRDRPDPAQVRRLRRPRAARGRQVRRDGAAHRQRR